MKLEVLNNKQHASLKVNSVYKVNSGYDYNFCPVYPIEYTSLQSDYPIFFTKNSDDGFQTVSLLGFQDKENLFLGKCLIYPPNISSPPAPDNITFIPLSLAAFESKYVGTIALSDIGSSIESINSSKQLN